jgi:CRP-like cAMP-binding protein
MATTLQLFRHAQSVVRYTAGEAIFRAGDPGDVMYVVLEGEVEIRHGARLLATIGTDEILGELALIDQGPRTASALARTDCALYPVTPGHFEFMVQQTPYFARTVMRVLVERQRALIEAELAVAAI